MIASFFLIATLSQVAEHRAVFACSFVAKSSDDFDSHVVDLRAERRVSASSESWKLDWSDGRSVAATAADAKLGSVGGSRMLEWSNKDGAVKRAYISYSDVALPNGQEAMFLSLNKPSLWQPPGYICSTAALEENRS